MSDKEEEENTEFSSSSKPSSSTKHEFRFIVSRSTLPVYIDDDGIRIIRRKSKRKLSLFLLLLCVAGIIVTPPIVISTLPSNTHTATSLGYLAIIVSILAWGIPMLLITFREIRKLNKEKMSASSSINGWNKSPYFFSELHDWSEVDNIRMQEGNEKYLDIFFKGRFGAFYFLRSDETFDVVSQPELKAFLEEKIGDRLKFKPRKGQ